MRVGAIGPVFGFSNSDPGFSVSAEPKIGRHDTNDCVSFTAHAYQSPNHIRVVAEQPGPCAVTDNRNWSNAGLVIFRREAAAEQRIYLEDSEEISANATTLDELRCLTQRHTQTRTDDVVSG